MISKCILFLVAALAVTNCCALGSGCAPQSGAPIAWDGLGSSPTEDTEPVEPKPSKHARAKREIIVGPLEAVAPAQNNKDQPKGQWEQQQAADQDDELRSSVDDLPHLPGRRIRSGRRDRQPQSLIMEQTARSPA